MRFLARIFDEFFSGFRAKSQKIVTCVAFSIKFARTNQKFAENWVASRMRRALFGQATSSAVESCDHEQQQVSAQCARTTDFRTQPVKSSSRNAAGSMKRLKAAFFSIALRTLK